MNALELRKLNARELDEKVEEAKEELFNLGSSWPPTSWTTTHGFVTSGVRSPASRRCMREQSIAAWERMQEEG